MDRKSGGPVFCSKTKQNTHTGKQTHSSYLNKRNGLLMHATTWMNCKFLSERGQAKKVPMEYF